MNVYRRAKKSISCEKMGFVLLQFMKEWFKENKKLKSENSTIFIARLIVYALPFKFLQPSATV